MTTPDSVTRREFVKASAAVAAAAAIPTSALGTNWFHARGSDTIRVGLIGCGGRGSGAAGNAINAAPNTQLVALADVFKDRLEGCRRNLLADDYTKPHTERITVDDRMCFTGFNAYKELLNSGVDAVILTTPPHFRPMHFAAAIDAGKHVFFEKPVAVDGPGIRKVLAAGEKAAQKKLAVVTGTQRRHEKCYLEAMKRLQAGEIGRILEASCYWNQGPLWVNARKPEWSDMEWQLRNWPYFTWLSGDHIVEQHVHNIDVCNWAMGTHPKRASAMGGRQVRTGPEFGHIFDHFAVEFDYEGGAVVHSYCRQIEGCDQRVEEVVRGTTGSLISSSGRARITDLDGKDKWKFEGEQTNPYEQEHADMIRSILEGKPLNEAKTVAESTLTAIMGRMAAYTGQAVTWDQALNSKQDLSPPSYTMGPLPVPPVAMPGRTKLE